MSAMFPAKSLYIGGRYFTQSEVENMVILYGFVGTSSRYATFRTANGTAGYQVPSGKTLHVDVLATHTITSSSYGGDQIGYGDTDIGFDSASAPTNLVSIIGYTAVATWGVGGFYSKYTQPTYQYMDFTVPQNKYPVVKVNQANCTIVIYGHLT